MIRRSQEQADPRVTERDEVLDGLLRCAGVVARHGGEPETVAAWRDKPSYVIIATEDRELDPAIARRMANRAGSKVIFLKGSHFIHISHPRAVARVIETAARAVK